jgi:hypothetical protein
MNAAASPETLARRRGRCRLCHEPILVDVHYVSLHDRLGWLHAECAAGYRQVLAEHDEGEAPPMPRSDRQKQDSRMTLCAVRALEEANGICERCETDGHLLVAAETPKGSGRFSPRCINRPACAARIRREVAEEGSAT